MRKDAIRTYVRQDFDVHESGRQPSSRILRRFDQGRTVLSALTGAISGTDYRYVGSQYGFGLSLNGSAPLEEAVARYRNKLRYLYVHRRLKGRPRRQECLDFGLLTPLSNLQGLSAGYMLESRNASAIEQLSSLKFLSLAWKVDETLDLQKIERLRNLIILDSPYLESFWKLNLLQRLALRGSRNSDLTAASQMDNVEKLTISESKNLTSVNGIDKLRKLRFLGLHGNDNLKDLVSVPDAPSLEYLMIEKCSRLESIRDVVELPNLRYLEVRDCPNLKSVDVFSAHPNLTHVFFMGTTRPDRPVDELVDALPNLKYYFGP
jgi:hypothetical protein